MERNSICPICSSPAFKDSDDVVQGYSCARCGDFRIDGARWEHFALPVDVWKKLSGWVREQNAVSVTPSITPRSFATAISRPIPRLMKRAFVVLRIFAKLYPSTSAWVTFDDDDPEYEMLGASYSADSDELEVLLQLLTESSLLAYHKGAYSLSVRGLLKLEEISAANSEYATGFVAMNFDASMNTSWTDGFEPAIRSAGFSPLRINEKDYVGGITDEIMSEIRRARFVVADYTGQKAGVYFEAGFALGLGVKVIPTCRTDEIKNLHFDIRHLNTLEWVDAADLAEKLAKRITAVIGVGSIEATTKI
jgi:hypothetical protein